MKILALSCSPSRGRNSDTMLDHFILGMKQIPDIEVEKIYLEDIPIDNYNHANSKGAQTHEIKLKELSEKITKEISGLVIATPTYNFSVPAHLKNFIDRMRFFALDMTKRNKFGQPVGLLNNLRVYFLVSGGIPNWAEHMLFFTFPSFWLRGIFLYFNAKVMGAYYSGDVETFQNKKILEKCFQKGKKYAKKVKKHSDQGFLENIFWRPPQE
ncbi:MAG: NAD(P)H-dependent oxidoreductase [bacterium]